MPIGSATYTGEWTKDDIGSFAITRQEMDDGTVKYVLTAFIDGSGVPLQDELFPKKLFNKLRRKVAPYVIAKAIETYGGTTKHPDVGDPDPGDQD